jgi:hypothetical protein
VGTGAGSVALSNLPAGCTNPGPGSYTGLTSGGTQTVNFTVACTPPPAGFAYSTTFGAVTGGQVTVRLAIDMSTFNDPNVNGTGPDDIRSIQGFFTYSSARLTFVRCGVVPGQGLDSGTFNGATAGTLRFNAFTSGTALLTGAQTIADCTFNVVGSPIPGAQTATTIQVASSADGQVAGISDLLPNILINEGTLP